MDPRARTRKLPAAGPAVTASTAHKHWIEPALVLTALPVSVMLIWRPGGTGAAEPCEPRQVREEAAVRRLLRVLPANLPVRF